MWASAEFVPRTVQDWIKGSLPKAPAPVYRWRRLPGAGSFSSHPGHRKG